MPTENPIPARFDLDDYDFPSFATYGRPALVRQVRLEPTASDVVLHYEESLVVNPDGSWSNANGIGSTWEWMGASAGFFYNAEWSNAPQFQDKLRLTGEVRGTYVTYEVVEVSTYPGDPFDTTMIPVSASYHDLSKDETFDFEPALPSPVLETPQIRWSVFYYGKQPSDFPWYPL